MARRIYVVLILAFLITIPFVQRTATREPAAVTYRLPSNLPDAPISASNSCVTTLNGLGGVFRVEQFQSVLQEIEKRGYVTDDDIASSIRAPERLLAIIEYTSRKEAYEGFGFSELLKSLSPNDLRRLYQIMIKPFEPKKRFGVPISKAPITKLTRVEQENLLAEIYKVIHKPRGLVKTVWETKSLKKAYEQVRLETIKRRLQFSLFYDGMPNTFEVITADPKLKERFRKTMNANKQWIDPLLFLGLWIPFATQAPDFISPHVSPGIATLSEVLRWAPPYFPSFSKFFETVITEKDRELALEKGLDAAVQRINQRTGARIEAGQKLRSATMVYLSVFTLLTAVTVTANFEAEFKHQQSLNQASAQTQWNGAASNIGQLADFGRLNSREKAESLVDHWVELANKDGDNEDANSPEMKELKEDMAKLFAESEKKPSPQ